MREIKFRAYIPNLKWIVPVTRINFDVKTIEVDLTSGNGDYAEYDFDEVVIMQYTGLKDKNGKEIYEGDIIRTTFPDCTAVVVWEQETVRYIGYTIESERKIVYVDRVDRNDKSAVEVIGNIYEDKYLLEGEERG